MNEQRRRGQQPLTPGESSTPINVRVSAAEYDRAFAKAQREGVSVPSVLRRGLRRVLDDADDDEPR